MHITRARCKMQGGSKRSPPNLHRTYKCHIPSASQIYVSRVSRIMLPPRSRHLMTAARCYEPITPSTVMLPSVRNIVPLPRQWRLFILSAVSPSTLPFSGDIATYCTLFKYTEGPRRTRQLPKRPNESTRSYCVRLRFCTMHVRGRISSCLFVFVVATRRFTCRSSMIPTERTSVVSRHSALVKMLATPQTSSAPGVFFVYDDDEHR